MAHILVVEDETDISTLIEYTLAKGGYEVSCAESGEAALRLVSEKNLDLVILDLMLPGLDGLEVCRRLRADERTRQTPIIMLTAKSEDADVVRGLELGADDYVAKPFSPKVLLARVRALLRRKAKPEPGEEDFLSTGNLHIDLKRHEAKIGDRKLDLSSTEFSILEFLARNQGWVFTRNKIIDAVRGEDYAVTERAVDVQILGLRKKLGPDAELIETVRGVGYRFKAED